MLKLKLPVNGVSYTCLGFSQGAATASRFCCNPWVKFHNLILYGGAPAHDLNWEAIPTQLSFHLIYGDEDIFVKESQVKKSRKLDPS